MGNRGTPGAQATAVAARQALQKLDREAGAAQRKIDSEKPASLSQVGSRGESK